MAVKGFKEIVDKKGYKVDSKDRQIFERELKESLFGTSATTWDVFGNTDMIEFVMFDSNDNPLPQGEQELMVRYISMDDTNIQKYFIINEDIEDIKLNGAKEFLVDTEVLIREAGYSNGIFKTQITLVNRRAGSEIIEHDKMWIHEISPSRTEIRILPVNENKKGVIPDLQERYDVFINDGEFRDDTISFVQQYVEEMDLTKVFQNFLGIKGKITEGQGYVDLIKKEFKIDDFGKFILDVKTKFVKSMQYWVENKNTNINSLQYGKPLGSIPPVQLSVNEIITKSDYVLHETIDYILTKRDILEKSVLSKEEQITFDEVADILKSTIVDSDYDTTIPDSISSVVRGCMDPNADNFNPDAQEDDGSCIFLPPPVEEIEVVIRTKTYYIWSEFGKIKYVNVTGETIFLQGKEYEFFEISFSGMPELVGDIRTTPKTRISDTDDLIPIDNPGICLDRTSINYRKPLPCKYDTWKTPNDDFEYRDDFVRYPNSEYNYSNNNNYYDPQSGNYVFGGGQATYDRNYNTYNPYLNNEY